MSDPDLRHDDPDEAGPTLAGLLAAEELDDEGALFVLSLAQDGRPVPAELLSLARERAEANPTVAQAVADFARLSEVLGEEPASVTSPGFTEAVLGRTRPARAVTPMSLARRLAVAATLLLGLTIAWEGARPAPAAADPSQENQAYRGDAFRADPYAPPDIEAGLEQLLPGRLDAASTGTGPGLDADPDETQPDEISDDDASSPPGDSPEVDAGQDDGR